MPPPYRPWGCKRVRSRTLICGGPERAARLRARQAGSGARGYGGSSQVRTWTSLEAATRGRIGGDRVTETAASLARTMMRSHCLSKTTSASDANICPMGSPRSSTKTASVCFVKMTDLGATSADRSPLKRVGGLSVASIDRYIEGSISQVRLLRSSPRIAPNSRIDESTKRRS